MSEHEHDDECEMYSEACGCESRLRLTRQRDDAIKQALERAAERCRKSERYRGEYFAQLILSEDATR